MPVAKSPNLHRRWLTFVAALVIGWHGDVMENTEQALRELLAKYVGAQKIAPETEILHDLGVAGDDAWELLEEINARFGTNFSELPFSAYFPDETEALGVHVAQLIGHRSSKRPMTFEHLVRVIDRGAWLDPAEFR